MTYNPNTLNSSNTAQSSGATAQPAVQHLLVALAERTYAVRLDTMQEVVRYDQLSVAPIPNSPEWLDGIASLRGNILSVANLRAFLGLDRQMESAAENTLLSLQLPGFRRTTPRLLVVSTPELAVGLVVDDIEGVVFVQLEQIRPANADYADYQDDPAAEFLSGFYVDTESNRKFALLDLRTLISSPRMVNFEPVTL
jgi:purine-binding chemotaxis protein CheW